MTKALVVWLVKSGIFENTDGTSSLSIFDDAVLSITWPSNVGRLPSGSLSQVCLTKSAASLKADEWNCVRNALPLALWLAWRDIESGDLRCDSKSHNRHQVYLAVLDFCAFARILMSRSLTIHEVEQAGDMFTRACTALLSAGMSLTINWHLAVHYTKFVTLYGPLGGYSTWSYERANGMIGRTNFFRGDGVKATSTASRRWIKEQLLLAVLENPAPNASEAELEYIDRIKQQFTAKKIQGTLLIEEQRGRASSRVIALPTRSKAYDISSEPGVYEQILAHLRRSLPHLTIKNQTALAAPGIALQTKGHRSYPLVRFSGFQ